MSLHDLTYVLPYAFVGIGALIVLLLGVLPGKKNNQVPYIGSIVVLIATMFQVGTLFGSEATIENFVTINHFVLVSFELFAAGGLATILLAQNYPALNKHVDEEFYGLVLIAVLGTFLLVSAANLLAAFIGMETVAIPMFALVAWNPRRKGAIEGAVKYAITATVAAAFFMFGIALIYFGTGTLVIDQIPEAMGGAHAIPLLAIMGMIFLIVGIAFELALAPFHSWLADVFQASPSPVMAFIGSIAKIAMLTFLIHFAIQIAPIWYHLESVLWALVFLSIVLGNLLALRQSNAKRILAYSSVAQFGYVMMALASVVPNDIASMAHSVRAAAYYGFSYAIMNMVAFAVITMLGKYNPSGDLAGYRGLGRRFPLAGVAMAIAVLSLAGIPPTAGFFAKFFLFSSVYANHHLGFLLLAVAGSAVSVFYYLRILLALFAKQESEETSVDVTVNNDGSLTAQPVAFGPAAVIAVCAIGTLAFGIFAQYALNFMF